MADAIVILDLSYVMTDRFRVDLKIYEVPETAKFPEGVKVKFVLIDVLQELPRLLVDNHAPFGFHMHTGLPENKDLREEMNVKDYNEALDEFLKEAERIVANE